MDPATIVKLIQAAAGIIETGYDLYKDSKATLSETDAEAIHAALLRAQAATADLRPKVNAALDAAAKH